MRRNTALMFVLGGLVAAVFVLAVVVAYNRATISAVTDSAAMQRRQLATAAHTSAVSLKASTHTRVTTVAQRCDLTEWIWQMSLRVDPILSQDLYYSLLGCQGQLNAVKAIDAATPTPKPAKRPAR